jgi:hypothetical protein
MGKKEIMKRELGFKLRTCGGTRKRGIGSGDRECCDENLLLSRVETLGGTRKRGESLQKNIGEVLLFYFFTKDLCFSTIYFIVDKFNLLCFSKGTGFDSVVVRIEI